MKYEYPKYKLKSEFTPGTWGENDWALGEESCVDRTFYVLPDGYEAAIFKMCERTRTGRKRLRWEVYHNGRFSNNYFNGFDEAIEWLEGYIKFNGIKGMLRDYRVYPGK